MSDRLQMEGSVFVSFYDTERPTYEELVGPTLSICAGQGLGSKSSTPLDPDEVPLSDRNRAAVYDDTRQVRLNFRIDDWDGPIDSILNITTTANVLVEADADPDDEYTGFARTLVDLIRDLVIELDPIYVTTFNTYVPLEYPSPETVVALDLPIELERIPWLGVYAEPLIEQLGGRDHVLETPAWHVEELDNGSILIITTRTPWKGYHEKLPADYHLLDDEIPMSDDEAEESILSDPFATLDIDDIGTDVCVYPDDISAEFRNEDLQLVRVRVDDRGDLRRLDDDTFVRNVVTDDSGSKADVVGRMLADVPSDATADDLMVSALLHEAIPPAFVRLDDPDGETVVSNVMALDVDTSKHDLLVSLGRVAQQDDFTDDDLETMLGALDTLADLEDVEGIDEYVEEMLL